MAVQSGRGTNPESPCRTRPQPNFPEPHTLWIIRSRLTLLPESFCCSVIYRVMYRLRHSTNAPRIEQLIQNGKLILSLNDAIAIALADNLDIAVARYNLPIADTDILRTKAGGSFLGVNAGVVANTPGGGQGGIGSGVTGAGAGGTTAGAGGAGVGSGGFVGTTSGAGPQPDSFDPTITGTFAIEQSTSPTNFGLLSGLGTNGASVFTIPLATAHTTTGDITYSEGFSPGTALSVSFTNQRQSSNGVGFTFDPSLTSSFRASVRQHLLRDSGRGLNSVLPFIFVRRKITSKITEEGFRQRNNAHRRAEIENIYWDLVNAYEAYKVNERSLALAQKTLSDNQKQVEIGTLAPLDLLVGPEAR